MIGEMKDPRKEFGKAVTELAREREEIVVFSADSGKSSGFGEFAKDYPERYFECGIMEQGIVGMVSGMASTGKIPVFCAIAPFVTARPFEMFRNDLGYMRQNAKIVGRNCGVTYSDLGATHHSLEDFAIIRMIPGVVVLAPQDPTEIRTAARAMFEYDGPVYMRIGNPQIPDLFEEKPFVIGKGEVLEEGGDITIVSTGSMTGNVLKASKLLRERGVQARVIGMPTVWPIDKELIEESAKKTGCIITVEEHYEHGGLGTIVSEVCSESIPVPVKKLGIPKCYATSGPYEELLTYYGLDVEGITTSIENFMINLKKQ